MSSNWFYTDTVPAPENVTLDTNNTLLKWNHVFQPSDLPPDFELVHDYNTTYLVHVSYRNDVDTHRSVNVSGSRSLNLDEEPVVLNGCEEQEFAVQAVINNELYSQNSSIVSGNNGKCTPIITLTCIFAHVLHFAIQFQFLDVSQHH